MAALALGMLPYATPGELAICRSLGPLHDPGLVSFPGPGLPRVSRHSGRPGRLRSTRGAVWSSTAA